MCTCTFFCNYIEKTRSRVICSLFYSPPLSGVQSSGSVLEAGCSALFIQTYGSWAETRVLGDGFILFQASCSQRGRMFSAIVITTSITFDPTLPDSCQLWSEECEELVSLTFNIFIFNLLSFLLYVQCGDHKPTKLVAVCSL